MVEFIGWGGCGSWHACRVSGCSEATCEPEHRQPGLKELSLNLLRKGCPVGTVEEIVCRTSQTPVRFASDCRSGCGAGSCSR